MNTQTRQESTREEVELRECVKAIVEQFEKIYSIRKRDSQDNHCNNLCLSERDCHLIAKDYSPTPWIEAFYWGEGNHYVIKISKTKTE